MTTRTYTGELTVLTCPNEKCYITYGVPTRMYDEVSSDPKLNLFCPRGHSVYWPGGKSDAKKLAEAEQKAREERERARIREEALKDQLHAAEADAEQVRRKALKERIRISNGVCPCCNRTFENVLNHMKGQHPEYVVSPKLQDDLKPAKCSCGRSFATQTGLHRHQTTGRQHTQRIWGKDWTDPKLSLYSRHLTTVE